MVNYICKCILYCIKIVDVEKMSPRKTPRRFLVKSPRGKTKETGEGSQNKLVEIEDLQEDYVSVIQFPTYEEPLP
jgi:hypothetical protein